MADHTVTGIRRRLSNADHATGTRTLRLAALKLSAGVDFNSNRRSPVLCSRSVFQKTTPPSARAKIELSKNAQLTGITGALFAEAAPFNSTIRLLRSSANVKEYFTIILTASVDQDAYNGQYFEMIRCSPTALWS
jgi:hypothetical protein